MQTYGWPWTELQQGGKMTICVAAVCENGSTLVLAADRAVTSSISIEFEHPGKKMIRLSDSCITLTAGDALAHTELFDMVNEEITKHRAPSVNEVVSKIKECYQKRRKQEVIENFLIPRGFSNFGDFYQAQKHMLPDLALTIQTQIERYTYGLQILVAGMKGETAHIYEINDPGTSRCFDSMGYHAIGSGLPHAMYTLISRNCNQNMPLEEVLLIIYEAKKMAERAPGVGSNTTDICIMNSRNIYLSQNGHIKEIESIYNKWIKEDLTWKDDMNVFLKREWFKNEGE
jgi:20S proteasome alpha/beta subunit